MEKTIYWYDYETTGTDPARDRAIQFAGVRTDLDLNVIGEPRNLFCYPGDDVIPSPEAMLVTGLKMSELEVNGLPETQFIGAIHEEFAQPGTCVAGFNSIRFDDEFTRYILYRNFIDPYAREWQGDNSRWDAIDLFRLAQALRPEGMNWPRGDQGAPTFKLEALTTANGILHTAVHDAVSDVLATVAVVRKMKEAQPRLFQYLFNLRQKKEVLKQLYPIGKHAVVHVSSMYPAANNCLAIVLPLCTHPTNTNGVICYDLAFDPSEFIEMGPDELHRRVFSSRSELEDGTERVPLKTIHINRCPAVAPLATLRGDDAGRLGIDLGLAEAHKQQLQHASGNVEKIHDAFARGSFAPTDDPDLMLYQGEFFSNKDRAMMVELRELGADALSRVKGGFDDDRVEEMLFRYRARNFKGSLSAEELARWDEYRREVAGERLVTAKQELERLAEAGGAAMILEDLRAWFARHWP